MAVSNLEKARTDSVDRKATFVLFGSMASAVLIFASLGLGGVAGVENARIGWAVLTAVVPGVAAAVIAYGRDFISGLIEEWQQDSARS